MPLAFSPMPAMIAIALACAAGSLAFFRTHSMAWSLTSDTWGRCHVGALRTTESDVAAAESAKAGVHANAPEMTTN